MISGKTSTIVSARKFEIIIVRIKNAVRKNGLAVFLELNFAIRSPVLEAF